MTYIDRAWMDDSTRRDDNITLRRIPPNITTYVEETTTVAYRGKKINIETSNYNELNLTRMDASGHIYLQKSSQIQTNKLVRGFFGGIRWTRRACPIQIHLSLSIASITKQRIQNHGGAQEELLSFVPSTKLGERSRREVRAEG